MKRIIKLPINVVLELTLRGLLIPFGAEISYKPITEKDQARLHQFGLSMLSGIFLGYGQKPGRAWNEELIIADWERIENAERRSDIHPKVLIIRTLMFPNLLEKFAFL